jgi:long-chain fatty acid transport protein
VRLVIAITVLLLHPATSLAAGFSIFEAGARALAMGGAMTAQADDPSAIFFNPAGIAHLEGTQLYLGASFIFAGSEFAGADPAPGAGVTEQTGTMFFTPVNAYLTHSISPNVTAGVGIFNPFGLGHDWDNPDVFTGRTIVHEVSLVTWNVNPTVAWNFSEFLSVGIGVQFYYAATELKQYMQQPSPVGPGMIDVGTVTLDGQNEFDYGFNIGARVRPNEHVVLGASFRSAVQLNIDGDANFNQILTGNPAIDAAVAAGFPPDQPGGTEIDLPWLVSLAAAYTGIERWAFEVDVNIFGWSTFDELPLMFATRALNTTRPQEYNDKVSIRSGASFDLNDHFELRGGYYFDPTPQPVKAMSPLLPDTDRHGLSVGLGYKPAQWWVDVFGLALITDSRSTLGLSLDGYDGVYDTFGYLFGANLGVIF